MAAPDLIEHANQAIGPSLAEFTRRISLELAGATPELPSFPEVAVRVRRALGQDDISIDEVVRIVSAEPSLAVRLLQLANSVALNPGAQRVTTLRAAIARMGFNLARSATIAFAMSQMRRAEAWRGLEKRFRAIWESSARLAAMSYALARHCERVDADQALLAGMLSAIGKLFVMTRVNSFPALLGDPAMYAEIEHVWHARAGRALLTRWDLDGAVIDAACDFDQAKDEGRDATLSDVLLAAHHLAGVRDASELAGAVFLGAPSFKRLGVDAADAAGVLNASASEIASLRAALAD
jgi:HD-like signal output (HDOD) protein